jgi:inorganic phosphate transporter, PiT family
MGIIVIVLAVFLALANGANDNFKGVATLWSGGSASYKQALSWATVTTLLGSLLSLYVSQKLLLSFSGKGLVADSVLSTMPFAIAVAGSAALTIILASRFGFPVSTTHAIMGGLVGAGLVSHGPMNFSQLGSGFLLPLIVSPLFAAGGAVLLYFSTKPLREKFKGTGEVCICATEAVPAMATAQTMSASMTTVQTLVIEHRENCEAAGASKILGLSIPLVAKRLHYLSSGAVSFSRGMNDTPKIAALFILSGVIKSSSALVAVAILMSIGGLIGARRVAETISKKLAKLEEGDALNSNIVTAFCVLVASRFGIPVSTTHVTCGSIMGIGAASSRLERSVAAQIAAAWVITLPVATISAIAIFEAVSHI